MSRGDPDTVRGLQERVARALPSEHVEVVDGWWLRHSASASWWIATVLPHGTVERGELVRRIAVAERFYAGFGAAARFQITPGVCSADLDTALAERGYGWSSPMSLRTAETDRIRERTPPEIPSEHRIQLRESPSAEWFDAWHAVHGHGGDSRSEWDQLTRVGQPSAYASVLAGERVVAVGRAVAEAGWAGVFGMATLPEARGKGAARAILTALADWASARGADGMYLQVETDNEPALRLYDTMCFTELCGYHYRVEPSASAA